MVEILKQIYSSIKHIKIIFSSNDCITEQNIYEILYLRYFGLGIMYNVENCRFWKAHPVRVVLGMVALGCPIGAIF